MGDDPKKKAVDETRRLILARRASFVAAALASVACQKEPVEPPQPCLSIMYTPPDDASAPPVAPVDSTPVAASTTEPGPPAPPADAGAPPPPRPCLRVRPAPTVCLKVAPPSNDSK